MRPNRPSVLLADTPPLPTKAEEQPSKDASAEEKPKEEPKKEPKKEKKESKPKEVKSTDPGPKKAEGDRIFASPLARKLAERASIQLKNVTGTGPNGRITKADIEAYEPSEEAAPAPAASAPAAASSAGDFEDKDISGMRKVGWGSGEPRLGTRGRRRVGGAEAGNEGWAARRGGAGVDRAPQQPTRRSTSRIALKAVGCVSLPFPLTIYLAQTIARRLQESKQTVPHYYLTSEVRMDKVMALRKQFNEEGAL